MRKWSDKILPTLTLHQVPWTRMNFLGPFQLRLTYELLEEISPLLSSRERTLMLKRKGRDTQLCPWGRRRALTLPCLPAQCPGSAQCLGPMGSAGISRALRMHGKVSGAPQSLPKEGVIYCFQFIVANKFLIPSFPVYSEREDKWEKLGPSPISTKVFSLGWVKHLACGMGNTGEQGNKCAVSCSGGRTPAAPDPPCSPCHSERVRWHLFSLEHASVQMYLVRI